MKNRSVFWPLAVLGLSACLFFSACSKKEDVSASESGPHPATVETDMDANHFKVDHPDQFPITTADEYVSTSDLNVTGVVSPDVARQVPAISLASGRVVEIDVKLGDAVTKGQLLFKVRSPDIAQAFSDYQKAVKNEDLTKIQLERAKLLYDKGAIPKSQVEIAQNADDDALVDVATTAEHLRVLGSDLEHPTGIVPVYAPISGVVTDQQITNASGIQALSAPNPLTISDMTHVWVICDVFENDLAQVRLGEFADIHLSSYPDHLFTAQVANVGEILDPNLHTAKVRLQMDNNRLMRLGMFATATFHSRKKEEYAAVPATAVLHLHDRDWVYSPTGASGYFRRMEVKAGNMLPGNRQEILSGLQAGTKVVKNALVLQNTVDQ